MTLYKYLVLALVLAFIPLQANTAENAQSAEEFKKLAEQGDARAQSQLGYLYYAGEGVPQSFAEAVKWYEKAAVQGDKDAQYNLAVAYAFGEGVKQDFTQATLWYRRAADQGHAVAQYSLGISYAYGEGVTQDQNIAADWFLKSANAGYVKAQVMVGSLYHTGDGLPRDYVKAAEWYRQAAVQGDATAQYNLGSLYRAGKGVEKNVDEAIKLFQLSANQGYEAAQKELSSMERALAAATRDKAATPAETIIATPPRAEPQAQVEIAPDIQTDKPMTTATPAPLIVQENTQETVSTPAPPLPQSTTETETADTNEATQSSDAGEEPGRGGFFSGLKKFFTQTPAPATEEISTSVPEPPVTQASSEATPATPQTTTEDAIKPSADVHAQSQSPAPEPAAPIYPPTSSVTADFHKIPGDKQTQKGSTEDSEAVVAYGEGTTPAAQRLADHPEPPPTSNAEPSPEISPPVVETSAEPRITAPAESTETAPVPQTTESTAAAETTGKPGGLRGFFSKLFKSNKDETVATPTTSTASGETAAAATPAAITDATATGGMPEEIHSVTEPAQPEEGPATLESPEEQATPAMEDKPVVVARAEPDERMDTPVAETATKELQATPLDTLTTQAVEGNVEAQYQLAKRYYVGDQVRQDYSQAFLWYRRAALQGHPEAQYNLGTMYLMGEGIEQSDMEAKDWYEKAASQGHEAARHNLENLQRIPPPGETPAETTEVAAAEEDEPKKKGGVLGYLGRMFKSEDKEAEEDTSAEQEEPFAGTPQETLDTSTAAADVQTVTTPGLSDYEKGLAYSEGEGVPQNDDNAFILFESAAQQNYAPAQYQLGNAYMGGYGTEKNPETAVTWYEKSARQGYAPAQRTLASIYMNGENGIRQNKPLALAWYSILSGAGNVLDMHRRDVLKEELSETEVQESEKLKQELSAGLPRASASY